MGGWGRESTGACGCDNTHCMAHLAAQRHALSYAGQQLASAHRDWRCWRHAPVPALCGRLHHVLTTTTACWDDNRPHPLLQQHRLLATFQPSHNQALVYSLLLLPSVMLLGLTMPRRVLHLCCVCSASTRCLGVFEVPQLDCAARHTGSRGAVVAVMTGDRFRVLWFGVDSTPHELDCWELQSRTLLRQAAAAFLCRECTEKDTSWVQDVRGASFCAGSSQVSELSSLRQRQRAPT